MAKFLGEQAAQALVGKIKEALATKAETTALNEKLDKSSIVDNLTSDSTEAPLSAAQGKELKSQIDAKGEGDMKTATYVTEEGTGTAVDNAKKATHATEADSATTAATATKADDADKLGGTEAASYALKTDISAALTGKYAPITEGKIPAEYLPSYVDDVVEGYYHESTFYKEKGHENPLDGEQGKIYVDLTDGAGECYRYTGSQYVAITATGGMSEITSEEIDGYWSD